MHTAYGYAFLASRAERIQGHDLQRARRIRVRARRHYIRALEVGLERLDRRHPGFAETLQRNPGEAVALATAEDVPLLYWTGASLGAAIGLSKDKPEMLIRLPQVGALAFRVTELTPGYLDGAGFELLMLYEAGRPTMMGGSLPLA
ncbi:MAG: TRAP transporter TatT component family protein, partial [Candidatus Neomarinimicrobiota bacterium]